VGSSLGFGLASAGIAGKTAWCSSAITAVELPDNDPAKQDGSVPEVMNEGIWVPKAVVSLIESTPEDDALAAQAYAKSTHVGK
jgi:hypothetical protein